MCLDNANPFLLSAVLGTQRLSLVTCFFVLNNVNVLVCYEDHSTWFVNRLFLQLDYRCSEQKLKEVFSMAGSVSKVSTSAHGLDTRSGLV